MSPSDLTWASLTRPYTVTHGSGRRHGPYDPRRLIRAVTMGYDPAGNDLHVAMPRFRLSQADAAALVAYLRTLEHETDPGAYVDRLVIGTVLPLGEPSGAAAAAVLRAWVEAVNRTGGLYDRALELRVVEIPLDQWLTVEPVFALVAPFPLSDEAVFSARETPVVLPFTQAPTVAEARRHALAAAKILTSALERVGRRLSRSSLSAALEEL